MTKDVYHYIKKRTISVIDLYFLYLSLHKNLKSNQGEMYEYLKSVILKLFTSEIFIYIHMSTFLTEIEHE